MLKLTWTETGLDDLAWWVDKNPKILKRIMKKIGAVPRNVMKQVKEALLFAWIYVGTIKEAAGPNMVG